MLQKIIFFLYADDKLFLRTIRNYRAIFVANRTSKYIWHIGFWYASFTDVRMHFECPVGDKEVGRKWLEHFHYGRCISFVYRFDLYASSLRFNFLVKHPNIRWHWMSQTIFVRYSYKHVFGLIHFSAFLFNWYIRCYVIFIFCQHLYVARSKYKVDEPRCKNIQRIRRLAEGGWCCLLWEFQCPERIVHKHNNQYLLFSYCAPKIFA